MVAACAPARGLWWGAVTLDLVADLTSYRTPPGAFQCTAATGVTITRAGRADLPGVRAFEEATFPSWARWFATARPEHILVARDRS